jgi:hypothetical protein
VDLEVHPKPEVSPDVVASLRGKVKKLEVIEAEAPSWTLLDGLAEGTDTLVLRFRGAPLREGNVTFPALSLKDEAGKEVGRVEGAASPLHVVPSNSGGGVGARPSPPELFPPLGVRFPTRYLVFLAGLGFCLLIGALTWGWLASRKWQASRPRQVLPELPRTEDEIALDRLSDLVRSGMLERGEFRRFCFGISETIKDYLGRRYGFDASESTTFELLAQLRDHALASRFEGRVAQLFESLDLVKFASSPTDHLSCMGYFKECEALIRETRRPRAAMEARGGERS